MNKDIALSRQECWKNIHKKYYENNTKALPFVRDFLKKLVKHNNAQSVLELGCNSGGNLLYLEKVLPPSSLVGIDINENAIEHGRNVEGVKSKMMVQSIYDLSNFADNSFDMVFTSGVLIHIPPDKVASVMSEMKRISSKFILNIEDNGEPRVFWERDGVPHRWVHDYIQMYKDMGIDASMQDVKDWLGKSSGGVHHFIWSSLGDSKFELCGPDYKV